jgi:soluble lytic murein transglycosylase
LGDEMSIKLKRIIKVTILAILIVAMFYNIFNVMLKVNYPIKYADSVAKYSHKYDIDPYLVLSIIKAESKFNPNAISRTEAMGLMQIAKGTGRWGAEQIGLRDFTEDDLYNPDINIQIGCWYINNLRTEFGRDNLETILAAYNGGSGNVSKWLQNPEYSKDGITLEHIPFAETRLYVIKVTDFYKRYKKIYDK